MLLLQDRLDLVTAAQPDFNVFIGVQFNEEFSVDTTRGAKKIDRESYNYKHTALLLHTMYSAVSTACI